MARLWERGECLQEDKYPRCIPRYQPFLRHPPGYQKSPATTAATATEPPLHPYTSTFPQTKTKHSHLLRIMKLTLVAVVSILFTLASGLALPNLTPRATVIRPEIGIMIREDYPRFPFPPGNMVVVSRMNGAHNVKTLLGFVVPPCTGKCTISFTDALTILDSRTLQLFTTIGYPAEGNTWESKPSTNNHIATFLVNIPGPATVLEDHSLTFPCPATTTRLGYEVQPVNDNDYVSWAIDRGGFIITCD